MQCSNIIQYSYITQSAESLHCLSVCLQKTNSLTLHCDNPYYPSQLHRCLCLVNVHFVRTRSVNCGVSFHSLYWTKFMWTLVILLFINRHFSNLLDLSKKTTYLQWTILSASISSYWILHTRTLKQVSILILWC
jgi:hypothetical protein